MNLFSMESEYLSERRRKIQGYRHGRGDPVLKKATSLPRSSTPEHTSALVGIARQRTLRSERRSCLLQIVLSVLILSAAAPSIYFLLYVRLDETQPGGMQVDNGAGGDGQETRSLTTQKDIHPKNILLPSSASSRIKPPLPVPDSIPNVIIFTHHTNLLQASVNRTHGPEDAKPMDELVALQDNVRRIIQLHPTAEVRFLTDDDCRRSIFSVFATIAKDDTNKLINNGTDAAYRLVDYFNRERHGMYKADLCRGAALWETGGLYFDVDLGVRMNIFEALQKSHELRGQDAPETKFCTIRVHKHSNRPGAFFQAFIGATPRHAIISRYVELFLMFYDGKLPEYKQEPLGVVLLKRAMEDVLALDSASAETIELWQEVLYKPEMKKSLERIVPYPTWGTRRACKFIVLSSLKPPFIVPFYSRIGGSRMCPMNATETEVSKKKRKRNKGNNG